MSEDVPTFGRENLERKDQPTWDSWVWWHKNLTDPVPSLHYPWCRCGAPGCLKPRST